VVAGLAPAVPLAEGEELLEAGEGRGHGPAGEPEGGGQPPQEGEESHGRCPREGAILCRGSRADGGLTVRASGGGMSGIILAAV
jgi:hypothetical protein